MTYFVLKKILPLALNFHLFVLLSTLDLKEDVMFPVRSNLTSEDSDEEHFNLMFRH